MAGRVVVAVGTKKGLFVLEGSPAARKLELRGPFFPGMPLNTVLIDRRSKTPKVDGRAQLALVRHDDPGEQRPGQEVQADEIGPRLRGRRRTHVEKRLVARAGRRFERLPLRRRAGGPVPQRRRRRHLGESRRASPIIRMPGSGSPATAGCACTPSCTTAAPCTWAFRRAAITPAATARRASPPRTRASAPASSPTPSPSSASAFTRSRRIPTGPSGCTCRTTAASRKIPTLGVLRSDDGGKTWQSIAKGLPSDFGFPIAVHPHDADTVYVVPLEAATRTCPASAARGVAQRQRRQEVATADRRPAEKRRLVHGAARRAWTSTTAAVPRSGSARRPASFGAAATAATPSNASPPRCRRSIASRRQSCNQRRNLCRR